MVPIPPAPRVFPVNVKEGILKCHVLKHQQQDEPRQAGFRGAHRYGSERPVARPLKLRIDLQKTQCGVAEKTTARAARRWREESSQQSYWEGKIGPTLHTLRRKQLFQGFSRILPQPVKQRHTLNAKNCAVGRARLLGFGFALDVFLRILR